MYNVMCMVRILDGVNSVLMGNSWVKRLSFSNVMSVPLYFLFLGNTLNDSHLISDFYGNSSHVTSLYCRSSPNSQRNLPSYIEKSSILIPGFIHHCTQPGSSGGWQSACLMTKYDTDNMIIIVIPWSRKSGLVGPVQHKIMIGMALLKYGDLYSYSVSSYSVLGVEIQRHSMQSDLGCQSGKRMPLPAIIAA